MRVNASWGQGGPGRLVHVVQLAPGMRPARGLLDDAALVEPCEPGIAIRLEDAAELGQMRPWVLAAAIWRVAVEHRRRGRPGERSIVARIDPQSTRLGSPSPGGEHGHRRVVRVQPLGCHHVPGQGIDQGAHQGGGLADPGGHRGTFQFDTVPGVDLALPIQRQVVGVFRNQHMGQQARAGAAGARSAGSAWGPGTSPRSSGRSRPGGRGGSPRTGRAHTPAPRSRRCRPGAGRRHSGCRRIRRDDARPHGAAGARAKACGVDFR